jgi:hypothetical protein
LCTWYRCLAFMCTASLLPLVHSTSAISLRVYFVRYCRMGFLNSEVMRVVSGQ